MKQLLLIILTIFTLSSCCAFSIDPQFTAPKETKINNAYISPHTKAYIWDQMITYLNDLYSPYTINEKDFDKGTITFSYSGDPCPYVDCGMLVANFKMPYTNGIFQKEPACSEYVTYTICEEHETPRKSTVRRSLHLETSTTVTLTQLTNVVKVDIMTLYILSKEMMIHDGYGLFKGHRYDEVTFPTHSNGQFPETPSICKANGNLENGILELAK